LGGGSDKRQKSKDKNSSTVAWLCRVTVQKDKRTMIGEEFTDLQISILQSSNQQTCLAGRQVNKYFRLHGFWFRKLTTPLHHDQP
jgi:hypothetical protein